MNPGAIEEVGQTTRSFFDTLKSEPLSLALILMNMCLLLFFYVLLTAVAKQREHEIGLLYADKKEVREMLSKCIVPEKSAVPIPETSTPTEGHPEQ